MSPGVLDGEGVRKQIKVIASSSFTHSAQVDVQRGGGGGCTVI